MAIGRRGLSVMSAALMWTPLRLGSTAAVMTSCVLLHLVNMAECVAFEKII